MGRPPSNGGPSFRFNQAEIAEMEAILQAHKITMPERQVLVSLAEKFSNSEERLGKIEVQMKQVWNWFQNRRYAIRAKAAKSPGKLNITQMMQRDDSATVRSLPQVPQHQHPTVPSASVRTFPQAPQHPPAFSVGRVTYNPQMEYEAKSARDGAWYDVSTFLSHRSIETGDPEVLVRFVGFGAEEDEWVIVKKNVRQRSLPCESSECVAVLPADLILCFQEGKEQALYFDAHVLDAQRRRHDIRGCRCRFLVRYDHDQSEEIVALRKICRRPETDYRLQQLHAVNESLSANQNKIGANNNIHVSTLRVYPPADVQPKQPMVQPSTAEVQPKQHKVEPTVQPSTAEAPQKRQRLDSPVAPEGSQKQLEVEPNVQQNQHSVQPAMHAPSPEGSQMQLKVEPAVLSAPPGYVPHNQHSVQPAMLSRSPEVPCQHKIESVVPATSAQLLVGSQNVEPVEPVSLAQESEESKNVVGEVQVEVQKVQPVVHDPSDQASQGPGNVESVVPVSSAQDSVESKNVVPVDEVQVDLQKVQLVMHDSSTEVVSIEPQEVQTEEDHDKAVVSGLSVEVQAELHEVQPHASEPETKTEEPVIPVSSNDPNVVKEAKTEEPVGPVSSSDPTVVDEAEIEQPKVEENMNNDNKVENSDIGQENEAVAMEEGSF